MCSCMGLCVHAAPYDTRAPSAACVWGRLGGVQCLQFSTDQAQDLKRLEKLTQLFFALTVYGESAELGAHTSAAAPSLPPLARLLAPVSPCDRLAYAMHAHTTTGVAGCCERAPSAAATLLHSVALPKHSGVW